MCLIRCHSDQRQRGTGGAGGRGEEGKGGCTHKKKQTSSKNQFSLQEKSVNRKSEKKEERQEERRRRRRERYMFANTGCHNGEEYLAWIGRMKEEEGPVSGYV